MPKGGARKEIDCGNQVFKKKKEKKKKKRQPSFQNCKGVRGQPSCQNWEEKKKKEFNYLGNEVAENEQLAQKKKKKKIINMTDAHLLYISVVHRTLRQMRTCRDCPMKRCLLFFYTLYK